MIHMRLSHPLTVTVQLELVTLFTVAPGENVHVVVETNDATFCAVNHVVDQQHDTRFPNIEALISIYKPEPQCKCLDQRQQRTWR